MCDVGYFCANFSLPGPLCSRLRPDVCDRQTSDVRCASSLNAPYPRGGGTIKGHMNGVLMGTSESGKRLGLMRTKRRKADKGNEEWVDCSCGRLPERPLT